MPIDVTSTARDAAYVTVGAGVLTFQKAQVGRRRARARLDDRLAGAKDQLRARAEPITEGVRSRLPEPVAKVVEEGRSRLHATVSDTAA